MKDQRIRGFKIILLICFISSTALAITPQEIKESYQKSYNYEKIQDYTNALRALNPVYEAYPEGYTINLRLGWLYYLNSNLANSVFHYQQAVKKSPNAIDAKLGLMLPLMAQAKYKEVESLCYRVINTDYYNYTANLKLAYVLRLQQKYDLAQKVLDKMLTIFPIDVALLSELALIREADGDLEQASAIFWDVLILDPENTAARAYFARQPAEKPAE
ncbi:MAG: tetratricopeptide repeat protein [Calditrichia bacterium]